MQIFAFNTEAYHFFLFIKGMEKTNYKSCYKDFTGYFAKLSSVIFFNWIPNLLSVAENVSRIKKE